MQPIRPSALVHALLATADGALKQHGAVAVAIISLLELEADTLIPSEDFQGFLEELDGGRWRVERLEVFHLHHLLPSVGQDPP